MAKNTVNDMFLTAKEKSANDFALGKEMIDAVDGMLRPSPKRVRRINENWHLHSGTWPEMADYLGEGVTVLDDNDSGGEPMNMNDFIVHHPKLNNVTNYIMGDIITQPLIPIVKDLSAYGRKYREETRLKKLKDYYYQSMYAPQSDMIAQQVRQEYMDKNGVTDPMALNPDEQKQMQMDLQSRLKEQIPRSIIDDLKKIKTPDEKIKQVLLEYDIKAYDIEEKFMLGGEQAVVAYEEYYRIGRRGVKPTMEVLNAKWVSWAGSENCDYSEDGDIANYRQYLTPHAFIAKYGREVIKKKGFMNEIEKYFTDVPGSFRAGIGGRRTENSPSFIDGELDFVDMLGENPGLIKHDWRTLVGQQEIAGLYGALSSHHTAGRGIMESYNCFRWTENITYVQREEEGKINEYFFSADYRIDKTKDKMVRKFPISRVYHGTKVADRFYVGYGPVPWQFFGGIQDFEPKLTICGRKYSKSNGTEEDTTLMGPAIQYQLRYNITASKLEDLEKKDIGKITFWNTEMKPAGWDDRMYMEMMMKLGNVPYTDNQTGQSKDTKPAFVIDAGSSSKMDEYRRSMEVWEREMYKQMRVNMDTIGQANQYQSNALTQSNIQGAAKQLLPFHNKRRLVKQRVLNYMCNLSMLCLLEDKEKQDMLLDDFSRLHLEVNAEDIKAHNTPIFIIDDYGEAQNVERIKAEILTMLQGGVSVSDVIDIMDSKSVPVMREIAQISEIKTRELRTEQHQQNMDEINAKNEGLMKAQELIEAKKDARDQRKNQVNLMLGEMNSMVMENAQDIDKNKIPDSLQRTKAEIASKEKLAAEKNKADLEKERIKGEFKRRDGKLSK